MSEAEPKPRKPRESAPWGVCEVRKDEESEALNLLEQHGEFDTLRAAEKEAERLSRLTVGNSYAPFKVGKRFTAEEVKRVEVKRS